MKLYRLLLYFGVMAMFILSLKLLPIISILGLGLLAILYQSEIFCLDRYPDE